MDNFCVADAAAAIGHTSERERLFFCRSRGAIFCEQSDAERLLHWNANRGAWGLPLLLSIPYPFFLTPRACCLWSLLNDRQSPFNAGFWPHAATSRRRTIGEVFSTATSADS